MSCTIVYCLIFLLLLVLDILYIMLQFAENYGTFNSVETNISQREQRYYECENKSLEKSHCMTNSERTVRFTSCHYSFETLDATMHDGRSRCH